MDQQKLLETLGELGLSKREADVYMFLIRRGPQRIQSIATNLKVDRVQTYRMVTDLKQKGIVQATIEAPTRYVAVPLEPLIDSLISAKKSEVTKLETEKQELIKYIESVSAREPEVPTARIQVIAGKKAIYAKMTEMVNEAKKEILSLTTSIGVIQEDTAGILDTTIKTARQKKSVSFRMLANISKENLAIMKNAYRQTKAKDANIEWRHVDLHPQTYPRFVIKDGEEVILYLSANEKAAASPQGDNGLWITSEMFVSTLCASFLELWRTATDAGERITELETGTPREQTMIIKEPKEAQEKIQNTLDTAKKEVTVILSSVGINRISENDPFQKYSESGVNFRVMAPIDLDNLDAAQKLSKLYQIRHVMISYLSMMIVDGTHLFMFKAPPLEEASAKTPFYLRNTFYTNDQKYVERASEFLNDIWKRGTQVSEIGSGGSTGTPLVEVLSSATIPEIVDAMLKNSVSSVLVTENKTVKGIIDQRDILEKVLKAQKDPKKTTANEIMSTPILTIDPDEPLIAALKTMRERGIPRLAVMKKGKLVAMLT